MDHMLARKEATLDRPSPLLSSAITGVKELREVFSFNVNSVQSHLTGAEFAYPDDLQTLVRRDTYLSSLKYSGVLPNIKFFPQGLRNEHGQLRAQVLRDGEMAFSTGFELCQCIISVQRDGSIIPLHLSPRFIQLQLGDYAYYVQLLQNAKRNIMIGHNSTVVLSALNSVILREQDRDAAQELKQGVDPRMVKHEIFLANHPDTVEIWVDYQRIQATSHFSWLKRV